MGGVAEQLGQNFSHAELRDRRDWEVRVAWRRTGNRGRQSVVQEGKEAYALMLLHFAGEAHKRQGCLWQLSPSFHWGYRTTVAR